MRTTSRFYNFASSLQTIVTRVPEGWLVFHSVNHSGAASVLVSDPEHTMVPSDFAHNGQKEEF